MLGVKIDNWDEIVEGNEKKYDKLSKSHHQPIEDGKAAWGEEGRKNVR